jgi:hypothetical protein
MNTHPSCLDQMLAIWNQTDLSQVRPMLEAALSPHIVFVDPTIVTHGLDAFEANVRDFRTKYPQAVIRRSSVVDSHHQLHRYTWEILAGGKVMLAGFDVSETNSANQVVRVVGFFGPLAPLDRS